MGRMDGQPKNKIPPPMANVIQDFPALPYTDVMFSNRATLIMSFEFITKLLMIRGQNQVSKCRLS